MHFFEDRESITRIIGFGESTNERVVHESIWVRRLREEAPSVVEAIGDRTGAAEEEFSGEERVRFEAGLAGEGVDLLGAFEGLAFAQQREADQLGVGIVHTTQYSTIRRQVISCVLF